MGVLVQGNKNFEIENRRVHSVLVLSGHIQLLCGKKIKKNLKIARPHATSLYINIIRFCNEIGFYITPT